MTTVREIAEFAGVSKSTVSLVLNNKPGVSEEMRQTVMSAVNELEVIHAEENLAEKVTHSSNPDMKTNLSVMVLHPPILRSSYVFSQVLHGIQHAAELYRIQLRLVPNDPSVSDQHISYLYLTDEYLRPDGVLVFGAQQQEPLLEKIIERDFPCVVLGREANKYQVSGIERDEKGYAYQLTQHFLELGHREIAFVGGEKQYDYAVNRIAGYQRAMIEWGIAEENHSIHLGDGAVATAEALSKNPNISAIIYVNDAYAEEGLRVLEERAIQIPQDIGVGSFDNTTFAQNYRVPLTSVAYNHFEEGQWSVKMLLDQIRHPFIEKSCLTFRGELIIRESS